MKLNVVTPEKKLLTNVEVEEVFIPGTKGELNVLPGHAPLVTTLQEGDFRYRPTGTTALKHIAISWGFCQVTPSGISVMAETAEMPEEIDLDRVEKSRLNAEKMILSENIDEYMQQKYSAKLKRAAVRAEVANFKS